MLDTSSGVNRTIVAEAFDGFSLQCVVMCGARTQTAMAVELQFETYRIIHCGLTTKALRALLDVEMA